jgi:hypothetical protein
MTATRLHDGHQPRIRHRARMVSWVFAPLALVGIAIWFLFNVVFCMGGDAKALTLRVCSQANVLPDILGLFAVSALVWLALALRDFGRMMGGDAETAHRTFVVRHAANARRAYRELDSEYKSNVLFALEMAGWTAAVALATLVFYKFDLAFPLALLVITGLLSAVFRTSRRVVASLRTRLSSRGGTTSGPTPTAGS